MAKLRIAITTESTVDLPKEMLETLNVSVLPYTIVLNGEEFADGTFTNEDLFAKVEKSGSLPKTQAINEYSFSEFFRQKLDHADAIIHFSLSGELSSSFEHALIASKGFENVRVVDTRALSTGIALLVIKAVEFVNAGCELDEVISKISVLVPKVQTSFLIDKTNYLYKGGRCSLLSFVAASILAIKPQIVMKNGKLEPAKKYRGSFDKAIIKYVRDTLEEFDKPDLDTIFITYTTTKPETLDEIEAILNETGFKKVYRTRAGCTISSHCGPNCLGILYFNDVN